MEVSPRQTNHTCHAFNTPNANATAPHKKNKYITAMCSHSFTVSKDPGCACSVEFTWTDKVNIQDFLQVFQGSRIGKMEDNFTSADLSYTTNGQNGITFKAQIIAITHFSRKIYIDPSTISRWVILYDQGVQNIHYSFFPYFLTHHTHWNVNLNLSKTR